MLLREGRPGTEWERSLDGGLCGVNTEAEERCHTAGLREREVARRKGTGSLVTPRHRREKAIQSLRAVGV